MATLMQEDSMSVDQYLTFSLRDEDFGIEITKVREVLDVITMTKIPRMPNYLSGVINLRGKVVPVLDLGQKLGMPVIETTQSTCIIITEIKVDDSVVEIGVMTDSVQMVIDLASENIEDVPKMGTNLNTEFIKGMGKIGEKFLILLDIDAVLASEGEATLKEISEVALAAEHENTNEAEGATA